MTFPALLSFTASLCGCGLAAFTLYRDRRSFAARIFAIGLLFLSAEALLSGLSSQALSYSGVMEWQRLRLFASALLPGIWLVFSLSFARAKTREELFAWRWAVSLVGLVPLVLVSAFPQALFIDLATIDITSRWLLGLGWAGYVFSLVFVLSTVLIFVNLERTLRASTGSIRWQIKFMILGVGGLFAIRLYTHSQILLFSYVNTTLENLNAGALIVASGIILLGLIRAPRLPVQVYLSPLLLYNSLTVLIVGIYLLVVGVLAQLVSYIGGDPTLPLQTFVVFLALLGLAAVLLSDELRLRCKQFVNRHLRRPQYDYRQTWTAFTQQTASLLDIRVLCETAAKMVSSTLGVGSVSIWLVDETQQYLSLGGSTVFSEAQARTLKITTLDMSTLLRHLLEHGLLVDSASASFEYQSPNSPPHAHAKHYSDLWQEVYRDAQARYGIALSSGGQCLGMITCNDKMTNEPFSMEDQDLLKTMADQTASSLLNLKLSLQYVKTKELEAFQTLSIFFLHDLKNLASTLSLTMQNLPVYYEDPEFRGDALHVMNNSVDKINTMCQRLSVLTSQLELQRTEADLNSLITRTLADLNGAIQASLTQELLPLPSLNLDEEQFQKVLVNLVLNANDAVKSEGTIHIKTQQNNGWAILSVCDNGCGMSAEFVERSLFRPFRTTKSKGLGIGLFQSKMIVEAHQGRLEAESEEGTGTIFRVLLPT